MQARRHLPTNLKIDVWERELRHEGGDLELLEFIKFGFPLGYAGPISNCKDQKNHKSAIDFPNQVKSFIDKEVLLGGVVAHTSPLMSREKKDSDSRRIIVDMTFPPDVSVNGYIYKNTALGSTRDHSLPSVDDVVDHLHIMGPGHTWRPRMYPEPTKTF